MPDLKKLLEEGSDLARIIDLRMAQAEGELPPAGKISQDQLAQALGLSRTSYRRLEAVALAKAAAKLGSKKIIQELLSNLKTNNQ